MNPRLTRCVLVGVTLAAACALAPADGPSPQATLARRLKALSGRSAGICSMPHEADPALTAALADGGKLLVHAMASDPAAVQKARDSLGASGVLGRGVYFEQGRADAVPLANWLADLVIVADASDACLKDLPAPELWRVTAPYRGMVIVGNPAPQKAGLTRTALESWAGKLGGDVTVKEDEAGLWAVVRRPALAGADEWTHFQHDGGNNAVSTDTAFKEPFAIQYITPPFTGAGGSSRFAGGRLFEMQGQQHKHPASATLVGTIWCRNAYNGQLIWTMTLPEHVDAKQLSAVATDDAFYLLDDDKPGVRVTDAETGALRKTISLGKEGEQCKWFALEAGRLVAMIGPLAPAYADGATYHGNDGGMKKKVRQEKLNHGLRVCAYDLKADKLLWDYSVDPDRVDCRAIVTLRDGGAVCVGAPSKP